MNQASYIGRVWAQAIITHTHTHTHTEIACLRMAWRFGCQQHRAANSNSGLPDPSHKWAQGKGGRRRWHPTPVLLPGKSHGRRSLVGCSPWGREESDATERLHFHFHALEKEMATHSSVLAWRIPGTGEPGGLPSMGSHRVGHD